MRKTLLIGILLFSACTSPSTNVPAQTTDVPPSPSLTAAPAATLTPNVIIINNTPVPTNTLQVYVVESGDTISEIAEKFRISQTDLIAANPDVNPNTLTIGQTLFIPDPSAPLAAASTLTPVPVPVTQAACHPTADSGSWCFALVHNNTADVLENVSAQITLLDSNGNALTSQIAYPPLDMIQPNSSLPVYFFFPNTPADVSPQIQILSAMQGSGANQIPAALNNIVTQIDWSGTSAHVSGVVSLPAESNAATQVWVAAVAYDKYGTVVGVRRWEGGALEPSGSLRFEFIVASVGGEIEAVEFAVQGRP